MIGKRNRLAALGIFLAVAPLEAQIREPVAISLLSPGVLIVLDARGLLFRVETAKPGQPPVIVAKIPSSAIPVSMVAAVVESGPSIFMTQFYDRNPRNHGDLVKYSIKGTWMQQWKLPWAGIAQGIAIDPGGAGVLFASGMPAGQIYRLDLKTNAATLLPSLAGLKATRVGPLVFDRQQGRLFAADSKDGRIFVLPRGGSAWREPSDSKGINSPRGLAFDNGQLYLADESKDTVWFCQPGATWSPWRQAVTRDTIRQSTGKSMADPVSVAIDGNRLWVCDAQAKAILEVDLNTNQVVPRY